MTETLPGVPFLLPIQFDLAAPFLAAIAATWAASHRGFDFVGVCMLAFVGSVGGGLLREVRGSIRLYRCAFVGRLWHLRR